MHSNPSRMVRERRAVSASAASSSPSPSATAVVDNNGAPSEVNIPAVPTTTTALAVCVAILAAIILAGVGFCCWRRRRNAKSKENASLSNVHAIDFSAEKTRRFDVESKLDLHASAFNLGLERPEPVFIAGVAGVDTHTGWVPQIPQDRGADLSSNSSKKSKKSSKKSLRNSRGWDKTFSKFAPSERSPPPSYMANGSPRIPSGIPLPPSPPHEAAIPPTPPTPPAKKLLNPISPPPAVPDEHVAPIPSPLRSASFAAQQTTYSPNSAPESRMMNVVTTFNPSLDDELPIMVGETIRMLEEYQDGWALVQRLGRSDAPKGVVPRSCLAERERVVPSYSPIRRI